MSSLEASVQKYFQAGLATSTQSTYNAALRKFHSFCIAYNILSPFPVTERLLCYFIAYLADQGLSPQTGKVYLAALRSMQISLGLPDPREQSSLPVLKRVQDGIRRIKAQQGPPRQLRLPITTDVLAKIQLHLRASASPEHLMLWAVAALAFFGFFRLGELLPESAPTGQPPSPISWGDVAVDSHSCPSMVRVHLRRSKCDQFGAGVDVIVGRTGTTLCPVAAVVDYVAARGSREGPFFIHADGSAVTKPWFVSRLRSILTAVGLPQQQYAGHSFRIGAATTAAMAGLADSTIQTLGRWHSAAFLRYIHMPRAELASLSRSLAAPRQPRVQNPTHQDESN